MSGDLEIAMGGHEAIGGYGGDPCYAWSAEEHALRYVCERRKDRR
jgi:hypothetical protein